MFVINCMVKINKRVHLEDGKIVSSKADVSDIGSWDVDINGKKITKDGSYDYTPNITTSSNTTTSTILTNASTNASKNVVENNSKKVVETKKVVSENKKDTRSFWQKHPWLRVLLTVFLCLLLIGLLMIAAYHIMHAINNSKKNDDIDEAKKADEEIKNSKYKLSEENEKKLKEGKFTEEDVEKEISRQKYDKELAEGTKEYIDKYTNEADSGEKAKIADDYINSQAAALKTKKLNSESLKEILKREQAELQSAERDVSVAQSGAFNAGITNDDINAIKSNPNASVQGIPERNADGSLKYDSDGNIQYNSYSANQQKYVNSLAESVKAQQREQADVTHVENKLADVQAYENATTDTDQTAALNTFNINERKRFTTNPAISPDDADKWISWEKEDLQNVQDFSKSFYAISDIAKENGFIYKPGTTTTEEMTKSIESHHSNNPIADSHGWWRKTGDTVALVGGVGVLGTALAGILGNAMTKSNGKTGVKKEKNVDDVNNKPAEINTKTVTQKTEIVRG